MMANDINALIEAIVRKQFGDVKIESVAVRRETDFDGDPVLRIDVVFTTEKDFDVTSAKGLVRHLRSELTDDRDLGYAFPLISFLSKADNDRRMKAAAV